MSTERYRPMRRLGPDEVAIGSEFRSAADIYLLADPAALCVTKPVRYRNRRNAGILHPEAAAAAFANA